MNMTGLKTDEDRDDLIFELIKKRYDDEWERARAIDSKAGSFIGFVSIAVSFLLGTSSLGFFDSENLSPELVGFFIAGIGIMIFSIAKALIAWKVHEWNEVPNTATLISNYHSESYEKIITDIGGTMNNELSTMTPKINSKAKHLKGAWCLLIIGLGFVFVFISASLIINLGNQNV